MLRRLTCPLFNPFASYSAAVTDLLNQRVPLIDPLTNTPNDQYIHKYNNPMFEAYLLKKRVKRSQIWPKIHIIDGVPEQEQVHINYQSLFQVKKPLQEQLIAKIVKQDPSQIDSAFIISVFAQDHFKQMIDEYLTKVLVCGKAPLRKNKQKMHEIQQKCLSLYRNFYFGQKITVLQRQIQLFYLSAKQTKSKISPSLQYSRDRRHYVCKWTQQDQRLIEDVVNWPVIDPTLSDLDARPFYEPLVIQSRKQVVQKFYNLLGMSQNYFARLEFAYGVKKNYEYSTQYLNWIRLKLFTRTIQYTKCLEFTQNMRVPPDITIQMSILNFHVWLILDRLKDFQSTDKKAKNLIIYLQKLFNIFIDEDLSTYNLKKLSSLQSTFKNLMVQNRKFFTAHFRVYDETRENPYLSIDALVWSVIFQQKVQRYSEQVYLWSEYIIKNREHFQTLTLQNLLDGIIQFDCFLPDPDYIQKVQKINPPLDAEQFEKQFKSNKPDKKYYYKTAMSGKSYNLHPYGPAPQKSPYSYSFIGALLTKILKGIRKYSGSMENYDHYSEMERQEKQEQKKREKSAWKGIDEKVGEVQGEFKKVKKLRGKVGKRDRSSSSSNVVEEDKK